MKVKDIIKKLQSLDEELDVYVYADHGQTFIKCDSIEEEFIDSDDRGDYMMDSVIDPDEIDEYESVSKICVISD